LFADVGLKGVTSGPIARKKPMSLPWLLSEEEDGESEDEPVSDSEDEVRGSPSYNEDVVR
jgi:hypothetical protein